jgi:hypothetical protein
MNQIPALSLPGSQSRLILTGIRILLVLLVSVILCPMSGRAEDYLPLDIGNEWYYESDLAETQLMTIIGEEVILGTDTRVRRQEMDDDLFENFWTGDSLGHVYLHGARNLIDGFEVAYLPPIRMVDAPLGFGKAWVTEGVRCYDLDGTPWEGDPLDYALRVYSEGFVSVPAGEFYSYGVGYDTGVLLVQSPSGESYDLFGRHAPIGEEIGEADIVAWYSDGIGLVQHTIYDSGQHALQLHWWNTPVSVESCSWGRLKQLFR